MASSYVPNFNTVYNRGNEDVIITYAITAHTDGTVSDISTDTDMNRGNPYTKEILGMRLALVEAFPTVGGTAPDAADVTVKMNGLDLLGGNGVNLIHATSTLSTYPMIDGMEAEYPVRAVLAIGVANQGTNAATFTIRLTFVS